jgi:hypothetical protein
MFKHPSRDANGGKTMSNQLLQWGVFFTVPWLTLFLMKKEDIKRFMPVGLMAIVTSVIIYELGITFQWWIVTETAYPLHTMPFILGLFPALTIWVFKFTYKKLWIFLLTEVALNFAFDFGFLGWIVQITGIMHFDTMTRLEAVGVTTAHSIILYLYQIWQEGIFKHPYREEVK